MSSRRSIPTVSLIAPDEYVDEPDLKIGLVAQPGWLSPEGDYYPGINYMHNQSTSLLIAKFYPSDSVRPELQDNVAAQYFLVNNGWVRTDMEMFLWVGDINPQQIVTLQQLFKLSLSGGYMPAGVIQEVLAHPNYTNYIKSVGHDWSPREEGE